jgi:hypothetical protein
MQQRRRMRLLTAAIVATVALLVAPAAAHALGPPTLYVREQPTWAGGWGPWVPFNGARVGAFQVELGVAVQPTSAGANRQKVSVRVLGVPDGQSNQDRLGYTGCRTIAGEVGAIERIDNFDFEGNGAYSVEVNVQEETAATCPGGPATTSGGFTWDARPAMTFRQPIRVRMGDDGLNAEGGVNVQAPFGTDVVQTQCGRDGRTAPDGSLASPVKSQEQGGGSTSSDSDEFFGARDLFTGGGVWTCVARAGTRFPSSTATADSAWSAPQAVTVQEGFQLSSIRVRRRGRYLTFYGRATALAAGARVGLQVRSSKRCASRVVKRLRATVGRSGSFTFPRWRGPRPPRRGLLAKALSLNFPGTAFVAREVGPIGGLRLGRRTAFIYSCSLR